MKLKYRKMLDFIGYFSFPIISHLRKCQLCEMNSAGDFKKTCDEGEKLLEQLSKKFEDSGASLKNLNL